MSILTTGSVSSFFDEAVDGAMKARNIQATDGAKTYVVAMLADFARPQGGAEQTLERPLTLLLDEALNTPSLAERFEKLRTLGDGVLYVAGFFADHFEARGVDPKYVMGIGQTAYGRASSLIHVPGDAKNEDALDVFGELADRFDAFVEVIAEVANITVAKGVAGSRGVVKLYERWLKTRSETLADALSTHGFVAPRGARVLS